MSENNGIGVVKCDRLGGAVRGWVVRAVVRPRVCHVVMTRSRFAFRGNRFELRDGFAFGCAGEVEALEDLSRRSVPAGRLVAA